MYLFSYFLVASFSILSLLLDHMFKRAAKLSHGPHTPLLVFSFPPSLSPWPLSLMFKHILKYQQSYSELYQELCSPFDKMETYPTSILYSGSANKIPSIVNNIWFKWPCFYFYFFFILLLSITVLLHILTISLDKQINGKRKHRKGVE